MDHTTDKQATKDLTSPEDHVRATYRIFVGDGNPVEVRALNVDGKNNVHRGYFDNEEDFTKGVLSLSGRAKAVYFTLNDIDPNLMARSYNKIEPWAKITTGNHEVTHRKLLLIDVDPNRPSGISSTNEELETARAGRDRVVAFLRSNGAPEPLAEADSGNGAHAICAIDMPNDREHETLLSKFLQALAFHFDDDTISVDKTVFSAGQISKAYGTIARKGDNTPARPHRYAKITKMAPDTQALPVEVIRRIADTLPEEPKEHSNSGSSDWAGVGAWLAKHNIAIKRGPTPYNGGRKWLLESCKWNGHTDNSAWVIEFAGGAIAAGCSHNSCQGHDWHSLRELYDGPKTYTNGTGPKAQEQAKEPTKDSAPKSERLMTAMRGLGRDLRLNALEDNVEIDGQRLDDIMLSEINLRLIDQGFGRADIADAVNVLAGRNRYHPVKDYLLGLKWDGENHAGKFLSHLTGDGTTVDYGNAKKPLHNALIMRWMLGCVARALTGDQENAFKHQTPMLVIIGPQGIGKSTLVRWWASGVGYAFHRESMLNPHSIDDQRSMVTKWLWEVSELSSSLRKADRDSLKAFITQEWHTYRKPYGKHPITKPTLCNLVGTLNPETGFLDDPTGHRRFLPVVLKAIDHSYKDKIDVNQLWAQVVHIYQNGESPELLPAEVKAVQSTYAEHEVENPLETYVHMYFDVNPNDDTARCHTAEIMDRLKAFGVDLPKDARVAGRTLNDVLSPMGLQRAKFRVDGTGAAWGWVGIKPNDKATPGR